MSSLQIGLAVVGGVVLAAVVAHGAWTARRNQPRQAEPEPARVEPSGEPVVPASESEPMLDLPALERRAVLDALIDVIAPLALESALPGEVILAAMPITRRVGSKPFGVEALNESTGSWEIPQPGVRYATLQAGVQLANRSGPLNEIEYSEFVVKTQALADALNGTPDFPEMHHEMARARELDQFAVTHDAQLSVTLRARSSAWSAGYVHQVAARLGFVNSALPGRMALPCAGPGSSPLLGLSFDAQTALAEDPAQTAIREICLSLEVTQVDRREQPYAHLRNTVLSLAQTMDGLVTDDAGQPLSLEALDQIGKELETLYDTLDAHDLSAGSVLARRLFS